MIHTKQIGLQVKSESKSLLKVSTLYFIVRHCHVLEYYFRG